VQEQEGIRFPNNVLKSRISQNQTMGLGAHWFAKLLTS
jgi:hypothetical protein